MNKFKKTLAASMIIFGSVVAPVAALSSYGQELTGADGKPVSADTTKKEEKSSGFYQIVFGSGTVGMLLWFALFGDGMLAIYFAIDCFIMIKPERLMPARLIDKVQEAMGQGDIVAAMDACQNTPSSMSNILVAAFQHVEEGFDVIQEAVTAASDLEQEKLMQRLNWVSVCGNLGPSLGLLGTVQGMILTFQQLASAAGMPPVSDLANSIGQALWTTAGGLIVSIPSITMFYVIRNKMNRLVLRMTAVTMEFLNGLRNVEVGAEEAVAE